MPPPSARAGSRVSGALRRGPGGTRRRPRRAWPARSRLSARSAIAGGSSSFPPHHVTHSADVPDDILAELAAQGVDVDLDRVACDFLAPSIELFRELIPGKHDAGAVEKSRQQGEL